MRETEAPVRPNRWRSFIQGLTAGTLGAVACVLVLGYGLSQAGLITISAPALSNAWLVWAYDNLRLSIIPFLITLVLYTVTLIRLRRLVSRPQSPPERVVHTEHMLDIWINLFFGIGVIWTAIGIRSALLSALGHLDPAGAAPAGAFHILQRLVDGGILLALSTTIVGGVGGYLLRLIKTMTVGARLQRFYDMIGRAQTDEIAATLRRIESRIGTPVEDQSRQPAGRTGERSGERS